MLLKCSKSEMRGNLCWDVGNTSWLGVGSNEHFIYVDQARHIVCSKIRHIITQSCKMIWF